MPVVTNKEAVSIGKSLGFSEEDVALYKTQFDFADEDGGGSISSTELKSVMKACGVSMTDAEVTRLVKEFDTDGTGDLDFGEFLHMMHKFQAGPSEMEIRRAMFEVRTQQQQQQRLGAARATLARPAPPLSRPAGRRHRSRWSSSHVARTGTCIALPRAHPLRITGTRSRTSPGYRRPLRK